jgi:hypothetical protein
MVEPFGFCNLCWNLRGRDGPVTDRDLPNKATAGRVPFGHLDASRRDRHASGMEPELGTRVHLRDSRTLDDLCDVTAPPPVQAGDLVASAELVYRLPVSGGVAAEGCVRRDCACGDPRGRVDA